MLTNLLQADRRMKLLAGFVTVSIASIFAIGCTSKVDSTDTNTGLTNTSSSPQAGGGKKIEGLEDRPIHISGSSLDLRFNYDDYREQGTTSSGDTVFRSATHGRISGLVIYNDDNSSVFNPGSDKSELVADIPPMDRILSITLRYELRGRTQTIIVRNVPDPNNSSRSFVEVKFNRSDNFLANRPDTPNNPSRNKRHFHRRAHLVDASVEIEGESARVYEFRNRKGTIQIGTAP